MNAEGTLMLAGTTPRLPTSARMTTLEKFVNRSVQESIRKTLIPYLGVDNSRSALPPSSTPTAGRPTKPPMIRSRAPSVPFAPSARMKSRKTPPGRRRRRSSRMCPTTVPRRAVERSRPKRRTSARTSQLRGVDQDGTTVSDGYNVSRLSIAVLINRPRLIATLGAKRQPTRNRIQGRGNRTVAAMAAGIDKQRGDQIVSRGRVHGEWTRHRADSADGPVGNLARQLGNIINAPPSCSWPCC